MAISSQLSFSIASICAVLIFSGMQMYKPWFLSSQINHILGGYLGSVFFMLVFTALGNLEACVFGKSYQVKIFPEVVLSLLVAMFSTATLHRVSVTTCILFSLTAVYYINGYSQKPPVAPPSPEAEDVYLIKKRK